MCPLDWSLADAIVKIHFVIYISLCFGSVVTDLLWVVFYLSFGLFSCICPDGCHLFSLTSGLPNPLHIKPSVFLCFQSESTFTCTQIQHWQHIFSHCIPVLLVRNLWNAFGLSQLFHTPPICGVGFSGPNNVMQHMSTVFKATQESVSKGLCGILKCTENSHV